nr:arylacetamide deacetylase-like [Lytechinus pictus]
MVLIMMTSCVVVGLIIMHLRSIRVPNGLSEPGKYRLLMASLVIPKFFENLYVLYHQGNIFARIRARRFIIENIEPKPLENVKGSNIRSRVTYFDGVKVRVYEPIRRKEGLQPGVIFIHGGGMVTGSPDSYDGLTRTMAERLDMFLVSIDYRLAPEHPFPTGYCDNLRATTWFLKNAHTFGVDAQRIAISGDSAGGNFAAGVSQAIHDDATLPNIKLQILVYPGLQQLDFYSHSYQKYEAEFGDHGALTRGRVSDFVALYLHGKIDSTMVQRSVLLNDHVSQDLLDTSPVFKYVDRDLIPKGMRVSEKHTKQWEEMERRAGSDEVWNHVQEFYLDPRFAPIVRDDLKGLPQAMIVTCGFDCLRDDGVHYARRLSDAGVKVHHKDYESAFHGVIWATKNVQFEVGKEMLSDVIDFISKHV